LIPARLLDLLAKQLAYSRERGLFKNIAPFNRGGV